VQDLPSDPPSRSSLDQLRRPSGPTRSGPGPKRVNRGSYSTGSGMAFAQKQVPSPVVVADDRRRKVMDEALRGTCGPLSGPDYGDVYLVFANLVR